MPLTNLFTRKKKPLSSRPSNSAFAALNASANTNNPMTRSNIKPKFDALFAANLAKSTSKLDTAVQPIRNLYTKPDGPETLELYFNRERSPSRNTLRKFSDEDLMLLKLFAQGRSLYTNNNYMGGRRTRKGGRKSRKTQRRNRK